MNKLLLVAGLPLLLVACNRTPASEVDNTGENVRDRDMKTLTPTNQGETFADRTITQNIRKAIMSDSVLSANADNIKIITIDGKVTLRGVVNTAEEKSAIQSKAEALVGATRVDNQLEVKNNNK